MRGSYWIPFIVLLIGGGLWGYALTIPIYTDADAPARLSLELGSLPREKRFEEWHAQLPRYETAHKKVSDWGRGLMAAGAGVLVSMALFSAYRRKPVLRSVAAVGFLWISLWAVRVPFSFWYYQVRQSRFDYPTWGDSVAIAVFPELATWLLGALVSTLLLGLLLIGHALPATLPFVRPKSEWGWLRFVVISVWLLFLGFAAISGIPDGDEGMVFTCTVAAMILLLFISASVAEPTPRPEGMVGSRKQNA